MKVWSVLRTIATDLHLNLGTVEDRFFPDTAKSVWALWATNGYHDTLLPADVRRDVDLIYRYFEARG